ncbi:MAG: thioredoxin family protein [Helicobacteraceae bacterium]|jgi:thioredoxin-related protein|nr:thioredoxin family protein [Helicobacteraceae bacterium]
MKKLFLLVLFLTSALFADLNWAEDYETGLAQAKKENKKVILMFTLSACQVCEKMKDDVYTQKKVLDYVEKYFVPIEINLDLDDKEGYEVFGTPTFYFLDSNGKQIGEVKMGGSTTDGFMKRLQQVQATK